MPRFTSKRHERREDFFLTKPGPFLIFLIVSYTGILWVLFQMLFSNINDNDHTYVIARFWFQRAIGLINLSAFFSFWIQAHGLIGEKGISPIAIQLKEAEERVARLTVGKYTYLPSIFWWNSSDRMLHLVCLLGCVFSGLIVATGYVSTSIPFLCCALLYLSLKSVGDSFMQLQWDAMIIELNACCVWLELDGLLSFTLGSNLWRSDSYCSRIGITLLYWLHYRLLMSAGFVKMASGCPAWRDGDAMRYHFWTQPLPNPLSVYVHRSGNYKMASWGSIIGEMVFILPIFFPYRIARLITAINTCALMLAVFVSGNFGFFNVMTAALAILCFDDNIWPSAMNNWIGVDPNNLVWRHGIISYLTLIFALVWFIIVLFASIRALFHVTYRKVDLPECFGFRSLVVKLSLWGFLNSYGLFARMTLFRHELIIQGTTDDPEIPSQYHTVQWERSSRINTNINTNTNTNTNSNPNTDSNTNSNINSNSNTNAISNINSDKLEKKTQEIDDRKKSSKNIVDQNELLLQEGEREKNATNVSEEKEQSQTSLNTSPIDTEDKSKIQSKNLQCVWKTYEFKYKPGDINRRPPIAGLHMPRLDWRIWFLPLRPYSRDSNEWFLRFLKELIKNNETVTQLLDYNPFADQINVPIKAVRVLKFEYRFPGDEEDDPYGAAALGANTEWEYGKWWSRRNLKEEYIDMLKFEEIHDIN